jgi:hypothetical protein
MKAVVTIGLALLLPLTGCTTVQPWEKGNLARPEMSFNGDRLETRLLDHVYSSREAAAGGSSVGGGGCGCN